MTTGANMRVYEIAREMGVPNKELIAHIRGLGMQVNNHMSSLTADDVSRVKDSLARKRKASTETQRLSSTVLRRRNKGDKPRRRAADESAGETPRAEARAAAATGRRADDASARQASSPVIRRPARTDGAPRPAEPPRPAATPAVEPPARPVEPRPQTAEPRAAAAEATPAPASAEPAVAAQAEAPRPAAPAPEQAAPEQAAPEPGTPQPVAREAAPEPLAAKTEQAAERAAETTSAGADEPAAPAAAQTEPPASPAQEDRAVTPVIIQGPPVVRLHGTPEPPPPVVESGQTQGLEQAPGQGQAAAGASKRPAAEAARPKQKPRRGPTVQDYTQNARSRFEEELERARARVREREEEDRKKREAEAAKTDQQRDQSRPAVGTVINLPVPRIEIKERGPARQTAGPSRFASPRGRAGRNKRDFGRKRQQKGRVPGKSTQITTPAEHKRVIRMEDTMMIPDLAKAMGVKASEVLKKLWGMGMVGVNINASIDHETAGILASEFGYEVQNVAFKEEHVFVSAPDEDADLEVRAPVVTVMGHVDHGKTSLLDSIRESRVAAGEAGGITQHVAAYKVAAGKQYGDIVFLDTPGHEAFTEMRARGAQATDIVVLVVAANDGVMPQTIEALNHAKDAKVQIIVAVNKCDLPDAQPERVRQQLADHGLIPEEWGGDTLYVDVSAVTGEGIDKLLEAITLTAELAELKANPNKSAIGVVIEAKLDRHRGPMATVLVQEGTLKNGTIVVAGECYGKVRAMLDHRGKPVKEAGPSTPVELLGLDGVPLAGETVNVADDERVAKQVVEHRRQAQRKKDLAKTTKISLENIMERISEGEQLELKIVLKADVQGSAEALKTALLKQSTDKVKVNVIQAGVGGITESDVNLAKAGGAIILGFHVRPAGKSAKHAEKEGVEINLYDVIYEAIDDVRKAMAGLLEPVKREIETGKAEVRDTFTIPRRGTVAGCMVIAGKVQRRSLLRVVRDSVQIYEGKVASLRRFKEDTAEVSEGYECGLMVEGFNDIKVGDIVEAYEIVEEAAQL